MKLVVCLSCGGYVVPSKPSNPPARCECGYAYARWQDPKRGILEVYSYGGAKDIRVIGINNAMIYASVQHPNWTDADWKEFVNSESMKSVPGYLFDEQMRDSQILVITPSEVWKTGDIRYEMSLNPDFKSKSPQ